MVHIENKKVLLIFLCITFMAMSVFSVIMAENGLHTAHCNEQNCHICDCINISNNFIKNMALTIKIFILLSFTTLIIQLIKVYSIITRKITLVELKVVQNK